MKVQDLIAEAWVLKNLDGKTKRFKNDQSSEAREWVKSKNPEKQETEKQREKRYEKEDRKDEAERAGKNVDVEELFNKWETAIGDEFPDGDGVAQTIRWAKKKYPNTPEYVLNDLLEKGVKKYGKSKSIDDYLETYRKEYYDNQ